MTAWQTGLAPLLDELWEGHEKAPFEISIFDREEMRAARVEELLTRYPTAKAIPTRTRSCRPMPRWPTSSGGANP